MQSDGGVISVKVTFEQAPGWREREWVIRRGKKSSSSGNSKVETLRQEEVCVQWDVCKKQVRSGLKRACGPDGEGGDGDGDGADDGCDAGGDDGDVHSDNQTTEFKGCENRHSPGSLK